jgi:hypothetical protein
MVDTLGVYKSETFLYNKSRIYGMPLTNDIIIKLNEITTSVSRKKNLSQGDENMIKNIFKNIVEGDGRYDVNEIESWFVLEGSWKDKSVIDRIVNMAHYQQTKYEEKSKLKFASDGCSCGN